MVDMNKRTEWVQLRVSLEMKDKLKDLASRRGMTISGMIESAVQTLYLASPTLEERVSALEDAVKKLTSQCHKKKPSS